MVKQYPHTLNVESVSAGGKDADGDFVITAPATVQYSCRVEGKDLESQAITDDGVRLSYSWVVYLPAGTPDIPTGAIVKAYKGATLMLTATVKRLLHGQLNTRLWL